MPWSINRATEIQMAATEVQILWARTEKQLRNVVYGLVKLTIQKLVYAIHKLVWGVMCTKEIAQQEEHQVNM